MGFLATFIMKWEKYYNLPEIEKIRNDIINTYTNKLIFYEEPHEYYLDGVKYMCVSDVTHKYKPVSSEDMVNNILSSKRWSEDPTYKYYKLPKDKILEQWTDKSRKACEFGTEVHAFGESMFYFMTEQYDKILPECSNKFIDGVPVPSNSHEEAVVKFWNDIPENMVPVLAETKVFNRHGTPYAGTFDILFYYVEYPGSKNNGLVIYDYKSNEDLFKNFKGQTLLWPFNDLLDMNESYYRLQLGCYQIPLENLGYNVAGRRLIWLKPDGTYEKIKVPEISERIRRALDIPSDIQVRAKGI